MAKQEQKTFLKVRTLLNCSTQEVKSDLDKVYNNDPLLYPIVARWSARFREDRHAVEDKFLIF